MIKVPSKKNNLSFIFFYMFEKKLNEIFIDNIVHVFINFQYTGSSFERLRCRI